MKVVYFTYEKEGFKKGGFARTVDKAKEKAKFILGAPSIRAEHKFSPQLLEFESTKEGLIEMFELSHAYGQLAERDSIRAKYALK